MLETRPTPKAGGPPLFAGPPLLIQYIRSYPPYWRPFLHPQPEDVPCRGDRDPLITDVEYIPTVLFISTYYKYTVNKHTILTTELYIAQNVGMLSVNLHRYWPGIQ